MAICVFEIVKDGLVDQITWKDGEISGEGWAIVELRHHMDAIKGKRISWSVDTSHSLTRDYFKDPFITCQLLHNLYLASSVRIIAEDGIDSPTNTGDVFP